MSTKPILATSFTEAEVVALDKLLAKVREGGDARILVRDPAITNAHRKFLAMREKAKGSAS